MNENIYQNLAQYIAAQILKQPDRTLSPDEPLISSGLIDSFHLVDLAIYIEDAFGVRIEDTELNSDVFNSLVELATLVENRKA